MLYPVVLAGGIGSRLWPVSRAQLPKQFIQFPGWSESLFQGTLTRLAGLPDIADPIVICNHEHRFLVAEQLRQAGFEQSAIILEPVGRNTAPAAALAALLGVTNDPEARLLVLPADHVIQDRQALASAIELGNELVAQSRLVTFGIVPGAPETGYGYIERGEALVDDAAFAIKRFVEKPALDTAREYLASGNYLWNSGMFMFSASGLLEELQAFAPDILANCRDAWQGRQALGDFIQIPVEQFTQCRGDSIDYAVMEHTEHGAVIPLVAGWNDLGAWDAMWEVGERDQDGNVSSGDVLLERVSDSYVQAGSRLVAAVGMKDALIVETADCVLVADKNNAQDIKAIVERLKIEQRSECEHHSLVYRPWGSYQSLAQGTGYQVKHIVVNPGEALSLQLHHRRAEHWTVIKGTGVVRCDEREVSLTVNESIFIPLGSKHRLANPHADPVEIIEVQVGEYLGEDDIVRFEDRYGRAAAE